MTIPFFLVDAFAERPFAGNPAGVCVLTGSAPAQWMQAVAQEVGASETAFVINPTADTPQLRWFTPTDEVDLCGHATLAAAHALRSYEAEQNDSAREAVSFKTASGTLTAHYTADSAIRLDFPADDPEPAKPPGGLIEVCDIPSPEWVGRSDRDWLLHLRDAADVKAAQPNMEALARFDTRGVIITAASPAEAPSDFVSRFFAPRVGVPEDPVTGSAHCALGPYWADRLGQTHLTGYQASRRGGTVGIHLPEPAPGEEARVHLQGQCCTMVEGTWAAGPATSPDAEARRSPNL